MRYLSLFMAVFLTCLISLNLHTYENSAFAQDTIGRLSDFKGEVVLERQGMHIPLKLNMPIVTKDRIMVEEGIAEIRYDDGSILKITPDTDLTLDQVEKKRRILGLWSKTYLSRLINIFKGKVIGIIRDRKDLVTEFETSTLVAAVRGTTLLFGFNPDTGQVELMTDAGEVLAFSPDGWSTFTLTTGESVRVYWDSATGSTSVATLSGEVDVTSGNTTTTVGTGDAISTNVNPDTGATSIAVTAGEVESTTGNTTTTLETGDAIATNLNPDTGATSVTAIAGTVESTTGGTTVTLEPGDGIATNFDWVTGVTSTFVTAGEVEVTSGGVPTTVSEGSGTTAAPDEAPAEPTDVLPEDAPPVEVPPAEETVPVEGMSALKFTIKPKISASWQMDSNFYKAESIEREVYTYLLQPGINLGVRTDKSQLFLDYTLNDYIYDDKDSVPSGEEAASEGDYLGHTATLGARYRPFDRLLLGLDESYYKTRDPARLDVYRDPADRDKYSINRLTHQVFYEFDPKLSAGLRYRNTITDYDIATGEGSKESRGMVNLIYDFTRLTSLDLEYQRWLMDYDLTSSDYSSDQIKLIFRQQFKYFSFEAGGGYNERNFDLGTLEDIDILTYSIAIIGQNPPTPDPRRSHITFSAEQDFNVSGAGDTYFKAHRFSLDAGHVFEEKILVGIEGYYQVSDYKTAPREDKTYNISGNLGYMFTDWLTFSLTVGHEERDSNLQGYDYDSTYYMAKLDFVYNLGTR